MPEILHIADVHLGSSYASMSYESSEIRRREVLHAFTKLLKSSENCDAILLPGDIFESENVAFSVADSFLEAINSIKTPVFYSCGNHDSYYSDIVQYILHKAPSNLHVFEPDKITCVTIAEKKLCVWGGSFSSPKSQFNLENSMPGCNDEFINILCMHGDTAKSEYNHIDIKFFSEKGIDYAALGHVHSFDGIKKHDNMSYAYSGVAIGRGFDECGQKGFISGTIGKTNVNLSFVPLSDLVYIDEKVDISDFDTEYEVIEFINSFCTGLRCICRFTLIGENKFSKNLNIRFIQSQCNALETECIDATSRNLNFSDYLSYPGLRGLCAQETKKMIDESSSETEKEKYKKAFNLIMELFDNK